MQIELKLYASLGEYLPSGSRANAARLQVEDGATPNALIDRYRVPREQAHLVLINGQFVAPEQRDQPVLKDGDTLAIWPPVAGG